MESIVDWNSKFFKHRILVLCHVLFIVFSIQKNCHSQEFNTANSISYLLSNQGFENVKAKLVGSDLLVAFENRRYRFQARGIAEAVNIISESGCVKPETKIKLLLLYQKAPIVIISFNYADYQNYINDASLIDLFEKAFTVSFNYESVWQSLSTENSVNPSNFKTDLVVIPQFRAQFGKFSQPVESNISLIPEYNLLLSKGLSIKAQMIIPLYNELDEEGNVVRPGIISVNQFIRLKDDVFFDATVGFFDKNRAGANFEMKKYFLNGRCAIGTNIGYTTDYTYTGIQTDYLVDQNFVTALLSFEYRYQPYDLFGRIEAGNFLYNELGARFDLLRQFGEVNIGFFALVTESDFNGGFNFAIPIPPRTYTKPKYVRVRPAEKFSWEYRAKGLPTEGTMYNTENELFKVMIEFNPDYLKRNILLEIKKNN